jgi:membrane-associated phospholipid phosphatase
MSVDRLPPWYDVADLVSLSLLLIVPLVAVWAWLDRWTPGGSLLRTRWQQPGTPALIVAAIALSVFFTTAEAVLDHRDEEFLVALDFAVRDAAHLGLSWPGVRRAADLVSDLTAPGLTGAVLIAGIGLFRVGRRREIVVLLAGTLSAWALFAALKPVFAVPRPRVLAHQYVEITSYAFPSGHVLMTLIVAGLIGWALSHRTPPPGTFALYGGAAVVASLVGVSRVLLDAHWLTDVIASLAVGTLWLTAVVSVGSRFAMRPG